MAARTVYSAHETTPDYFYRLLNTSVVPRPIAWVSSRSASGVPNLAPYSFFTVASSAPPVVQFNSMPEKDSVRNIRETGQFVINLAYAPLYEKINETSAAFDGAVSEFEAVGITSEPSERVDVPRVAQSPLAIECSLRAIHQIGNGFLVFGDVLCVAVRTDFLAPDGLPNFPDLDPVARLGRTEWGFTNDVRSLPRPAKQGMPTL